ncbi:sensor histidine kinase [Lentimicrobium sp. L6]|uniref:sensor histidine kinase n=1 Tax=Lentimicrobium sp. L6 TaxID=2735916 RepID=UPI00353028B5
MGNAIKYSYSAKRIWVKVQIQDNSILTHVIDEGQGIPENELPNVFKAYKTTSSKPTDDEKSTGLGLAIVKKIVEAHQGSISVKSTAGIGSEFTFTLPIKL